VSPEGSTSAEADGRKPSDVGFLDVLELVKASRGFDIGAYKLSGVERRMRRRMQEVRVAGFGDYADYLEVHPEEFALLFDAMLINVTRFFRDPGTWDYLRDSVIPALLDGLDPDATIRVWSAGCASGEEAYSLAMLFAEAMGIDACRRQVKIYATDLDDDALDQARQAMYSASALASVPDEYRARYFTERGANVVFRQDLRRTVIFGRHDLSRDAPISRVSLLLCRNTLMYFNTERQSRILGRVHFALLEEGFLVLGRAEMLLSHGGLFAPVELGQRVFRKVLDTNLRTQLLAMTSSGRDRLPTHPAHNDLGLASWDGNPVAEAVVDANGTLRLVNREAAALFRLSSTDIGRPFQDLELSYRPLELRPYLKAAVSERRPIVAGDVALDRQGGPPTWLSVQLTPITGDTGDLLGVSLTFRDITTARQLTNDLERANRELDTAYEELQSSNEELETTNEELQSTIEEQETTNEELQSTNEELESLNEELQATNLEQQAMNDELREKTTQLDQVNAYLESILGTLEAGVMVLDSALNVVMWNEQAQDLWGVRTDEAKGTALLNLDIGLPVEQLRQPVRDALAGGSERHELTVAAPNRRGRQITCAVTIRALGGTAGFRGAVVLMEDITDVRDHAAGTAGQ